MDPITSFLSDIMQHVATNLQPHEVTHFASRLFKNNESFEKILNQLNVDNNHHLMDQYNKWIQPNSSVGSPWTLESRIRTLEREQEKSRVIENSIMELLQEQRLCFENKLAKLEKKHDV